MQRRAQSQMGGIMSIGRSQGQDLLHRAPRHDVRRRRRLRGREAGDHARSSTSSRRPSASREIGARIPKGVLLVGPPGTGKTLIARAVAGEAGVPFLSVTGSDFMEMFVGVGASRVRDLFQTARKLGRAIIFVDEIDSIGRKRGAGLGGGHDEREQTLNQMLSEMDGFEATEGIVMIAATNRPDILDPALLRPGRFDRQVVVPAARARASARRSCEVHAKRKRLAPDVDLDVVARGTPGMSGADLSNLVNEAALFAVRAGDDEIHMRHFEMARDRVLMGAAPRVDGPLRPREGGHRLPRGRPRGGGRRAPQRRPGPQGHDPADGHGPRRHPAAPGRRAPHLPAGLHRGQPRGPHGRPHRRGARVRRDLHRRQQRPRRLHRAGPQDGARVGHVRRASARWPGARRAPVFLGDDLMHTRDYSDETARVIDEEVERILREQEERCRVTLAEHRNGLDLVARALLEHETIDGAEVYRLVALGRDRSHRRRGVRRVARRATAAARAPATSPTRPP